MGCALIGLIAALFGFPLAFFGGLFFGSRASVEAPPTPIVETAPVNFDLRLAYRVDLAPDSYTAADVSAAASTIQRRLDLLDVQGEAYAEGDRIVVLLDGVEDAQTLAGELGRVGLLELVDFSGLADQTLDGQSIDTEFGTNEGGIAHPLTGEPFKTVLTGAALQNAMASFDSITGQWMVTVEFTDEGGEAMAQFTRDHIGEPLGIVVDGEVLLAPLIQAEVSSQAVISALEDQAEAERLAALLQSGALNVPLRLDSIEAME
jgi:preprotein translocase subunit SecD